MTPHEENMIAKDGLNLRLQTWRPATSAPKGVVVHTHGFGEYLGRYGHVAEAMTNAGYMFYTYDLRGHGRSEGPRGHAPSYNAFLDDLQFVAERAAAENPELPLFLYGHSMGGQVVLTYVLKRKPKTMGVVVSAPAIRPAYLPPAWKITLARVMANVYPTFTQETGLHESRPMSHDKDFLNSFPDLALAHGKMSAKMGVEFLEIGEYLAANASLFTLPVLLLHGQEDNTISPTGSQAFYDQARSTDKTLKLYPGMYHEIHNETDRALVLRDMVAWLNAHTPQ